MMCQYWSNSRSSSSNFVKFSPSPRLHCHKSQLHDQHTQCKSLKQQTMQLKFPKTWQYVKRLWIPLHIALQLRKFSKKQINNQTQIHMSERTQIPRRAKGIYSVALLLLPGGCYTSGVQVGGRNGCTLSATLHRKRLWCPTDPDHSWWPL